METRYWGSCFGSVALSGNALVVSDFGGNVYLFCK